MAPLTAERDQRLTAASLPGRISMPAEDLAWLGAIGAAILLAGAFALVTGRLGTLYPEPKGDVFAVWRPLIQPEPREEVRSMLALAAPFVLAGLILGVGSRGPARRSLDPLIVAAQAVAAGLLVWAVLEQSRASGFLYDYFQPYLLSVPNLVAGAMIGLALTATILGWSGAVPASVSRTAERLRGRGGLAFAIALAVTVIFLLPAVVTDATVGEMGPLAGGHIPVQAEDYFSVVNGRTPLVDYIAQYSNLLPLALAPILAAFDSSITAFSIAMCVFSAVALLAVFGAFRESTRSWWWGLALYLPFLALALFPWHDQGPFRNFNATYYAVLPGRYLGPLILAWLCVRSVRRPIPIWALFGLAGLALFNNAEFGTGALLALIVGVCAGWDQTVPLRKRVGRLAVEGAAGLLGAAVLVCAVILIRSGELPDPRLLTYFNRLFLRDSYGLVSMPTLGLHWALYATYAGALLTAAVRYVRDDPNRALTTLLAYAGAFGLVSAMYFVGRSSQFQLMLLFPAWGLALAPLAWVAARSLRNGRANRARLVRLLIPTCAALIGFGVAISALDRVSPPWRQVDRLSTGGHGANDLLGAQRFVEANTEPGEPVLIIGTTLDHRVAERAGIENVSPLNDLTSLISPAEADRSLDQLEEAGGTEVFESVSSSPEAGGGLFFRIPEFAAILRARGYRLVGADPESGLRLWRRAG
jgi:hypothetical protein